METAATATVEAPRRDEALDVALLRRGATIFGDSSSCLVAAGAMTTTSSKSTALAIADRCLCGSGELARIGFSAQCSSGLMVEPDEPDPDDDDVDDADEDDDDAVLTDFERRRPAPRAVAFNVGGGVVFTVRMAAL